MVIQITVMATIETKQLLYNRHKALVRSTDNAVRNNQTIVIIICKYVQGTQSNHFVLY